MSTSSGMMFTFEPAVNTVGVMVVWVLEYASFDSPRGSIPIASTNPSSLSSGSWSSAGRPSPATKACHESSRRDGGRYIAMRRTTSAALMSALSDRNGIEPWQGAPCTFIVAQSGPFSSWR